MRSIPLACVLACAVGLTASAQSVISAHSGVIHYVEGRVLLNGNPVEVKAAQFPDVKNGGELTTEEGRAEVLLSPGVFLRLPENSSLRMLSNALTDTRIELLRGSILVEAADLIKGNAVTLTCRDANVSLLKRGLYRVDADPGRVRVYDGEALVRAVSGQLTLKRGKQTLLSGALTAERFDAKDTDELYRWASRRSGYIATANVSAARSLAYQGYDSYSGGWIFNPWYGMFTYVPLGGLVYSPFGYGFWSPVRVISAFQPAYASGGGIYGGSRGPSYSASELGYAGSGARMAVGAPQVSRSSTGSVSAPISSPGASGRVADTGGARGSSTGGGRGR